MLKKLFPHIGGGSAQAVEWIVRGAAWVKLVGDFGLSHTHAVQPWGKPKFIGRLVETTFDPNNLVGKDAAVEADNYIVRYLDEPIRLNPNIAYWEGPNECHPSGPAEMRWYAQFLYHFARILRQVYGKTAVIGGWSVGTPDYPLWAQYGQALQAGPDFGAIFSRHSYAGPDQTSWPYLLLRHREDQKHFTAMGYQAVPKLITEFGADDTADFGKPPGQPWKKLYGGEGEEEANRYVNEILLPGDAALAQDSDVLGAFLFTLGGNWPRHDVVGPVAARLLPLVAPPATKPAPTPVPTPAPAPTPAPTPTPAPETFPQERVVLPAGMNVREFPWRWSVEPPIVGTPLKRDQVITALGQLGGWYWLDPQLTRWVRGDLTRRK